MSSAASSQADSPVSALQVRTSPRPGSRLALELGIPGSRCRSSYEAAIDKLSRSVRMPGFRRGKVPRPVLLQQLGPLRVRATALEELVDSCFREAVRQERIEVLGRPELEGGFEAVLERFEPDRDLSLTLELDVEPTPTLRTTRGLEAEVSGESFDPARIDEQLGQLQHRLATLVPIADRAAELGDVAEVSYEGTFRDSGEPIPGGSSERLQIDLDPRRMIPGFVDGIVGMRPGESRTILCTFPDSYPNRSAASRQADFQVTLIEIKAREIPPLDDAFAQQASDKSTLAELRAELEEHLRRETDERRRTNRREALLDALVEQLEVDLPETMIQQEIQSLIEQTAIQIGQQGMDVRKLFTADLLRALRDSSRPDAELRLRRALALRALAEAESIRVAEEDLEAKLRQVRRNLSDGNRIDPDRLRAAVAHDLLQEKLLDWLEAHGSVHETSADAEISSGDGEEITIAFTDGPDGSGDADGAAATAPEPID